MNKYTYYIHIEILLFTFDCELLLALIFNFLIISTQLSIKREFSINLIENMYIFKKIFLYIVIFLPYTTIDKVKYLSKFWG